MSAAGDVDYTAGRAYAVVTADDKPMILTVSDSIEGARCLWVDINQARQTWAYWASHGYRVKPIRITVLNATP